MISSYQVAIGLSVVSFVFYGLSCLFSQRMKEEFERFRMARFRVAVGILEILGGLGLCLGWFYPRLAIAAGLGLAILMTLVVIERVRKRHRWLETLPAVVMGALNYYIVWVAMDRLASA